jgi:hypothetical protein
LTSFADSGFQTVDCQIELVRGDNTGLPRFFADDSQERFGHVGSHDDGTGGTRTKFIKHVWDSKG